MTKRKCQYDMCGAIFVTTTEFIKHYQTHHPTLPCNDCSKIFSNLLSLQKYWYEHIGKKLPCEDCGQTSPNESRLKDHRKSHLRTKPHPCTHPGCKAGFTHKYDLVKHEEVHKNIQHRCDYCTYTTMDKHYVTQHEHTHTGETPVKCHKCGREFAFTMQKTRHKCQK